MVTRTRFELVNDAVKGRCVKPLHQRAIFSDCFVIKLHQATLLCIFFYIVSFVKVRYNKLYRYTIYIVYNLRKFYAEEKRWGIS